MVTKTSRGNVHKTSRGMRKHVRRMKQESRKTGVSINELKKRVRAPQVSKTKKSLTIETNLRKTWTSKSVIVTF